MRWTQENLQKTRYLVLFGAAALLQKLKLTPSPDRPGRNGDAIA